MVDKSLTEESGTPHHVPTDALRARVSILAENGVTQRAIAADIEISTSTLRRFYMRELVKADAKVQALIGQAQLTVALGAPAVYDDKGNMLREELPRNTSMLIFLGKSRMGQRDGGPGQVESGASPDDGASFEFGTTGLTNTERVGRIADLVNRARARGVGRRADGAGAVGAVPGQPAAKGDAK